MAKIIKKTKLRDCGFIEHIQKKEAIEIKVTLTDYDTYFNSPTIDTELSNKLRTELHQIFK